MSEFNTELNQTGLRSSEIDYDSISISEISSDQRNTTLRPGVNDDFGTTERSGFGHDIQQNVIYGTDINIGRVMEDFKNFLLDFTIPTLDDDFLTYVEFEPTKSLYIQKLHEVSLMRLSVIDINCNHLKEFNNILYQQLIIYPKEVIPALDSAVNSLYKSIYRNLPETLQIRPFNCEKPRNLRDLHPEDRDQLVSISGLVIRMSSVIPEMVSAQFKCSNCQKMVEAPSDRGKINYPDYCSNCHANHTMRIIHNYCEFKDKQMIKLQESPDDMPPGETPCTVTMFCHQSLLDTVQPGDRVIVTGIYRSMPHRENNRQRVIKAVFKTHVDVLHFKKSTDRLRDEKEKLYMTPEQVEKIKQLSLKPDLYERLSSAIAPLIYSNETIKKGILLMLFGGRVKESKKGHGGSDTRSNIHILLCGDPATSKSQLLQYVYKLMPRSQYTSGKGSSEVGLTAYIARDPETRNPTLQSGALALADNGVCCIDEFDKMSDSTRSVLHEVMEQQTLSIAKAGVICQLNARSSVLAAANPVGSCWDTKKTIIDNIQLPPTLLSRFDLIFLVLDPTDEVYDDRLAKHIISMYQAQNPEIEDDVVVDHELLRDYISYAKENIHPILSEEAKNHLVNEYVSMRKVGSTAKGQVSAYPRQLESLIRLSEAHAKMRLADIVTVDDCIEARRLQREALKQSAVDPLTGLIDINILTTGVTGGIRKKIEEMGRAIYQLMDDRRVLTFTYQRLLDDMRAQSNTMITHGLFQDGLNYLKLDNKIDWTGKTIRKR